MLEPEKEKQINDMVSILKQLDLPGILILTRDASTLLMRQQQDHGPEDETSKKTA